MKGNERKGTEQNRKERKKGKERDRNGRLFRHASYV